MIENTFHAAINEEGPSRVLRGKIPAGLLKQMGASKGDYLELEVSGKFLTGGRIVRGKEADKIRSTGANLNQSRNVGSTAAKSKKVSAPTKKVATGTKKTTSSQTEKTVKRPTRAVKSAKSVKKVKSGQNSSGKKVAKSSARKTSVAYETPRKVKKVGRKK